MISILIFLEKILEYSHKRLTEFSGEIEMDESFFGVRRLRGKKGRGTAGKTPVFVHLKRDGNVFVTIVKDDCLKAELMPIIEGKILVDSMLYPNGQSL